MQFAEEAQFHRAVVQAKKAGDCKKAIQLIDDRKAVLQEKARTITNTKGYRAAEPSVGEMSEILYLTTEMQGLENRRILETRDCKKN